MGGLEPPLATLLLFFIERFILDFYDESIIGFCSFCAKTEQEIQLIYNSKDRMHQLGLTKLFGKSLDENGPANC